MAPVKDSLEVLNITNLARLSLTSTRLKLTASTGLLAFQHLADSSHSAGSNGKKDSREIVTAKSPSYVKCSIFRLLAEVCITCPCDGSRNKCGSL